MNTFPLNIENASYDNTTLLIIHSVNTWRDTMLKVFPDFETDHTLGKIEELCEEFDLQHKEEMIKTVFAECEYPWFLVDVKSGITANSEEDFLCYECDEVSEWPAQSCEHCDLIRS